MNIMNNSQLLNLFAMKNVDEMQPSELTQLGLQTVPTLLICDQNGGKIKGIHEGKNAFVWVQNVVNNRRSTIVQHAENTKRLIEMNEMKKRMQEGVLGYSQMETSGISDGYAYWSDNHDVDKQLDTAQTKQFMPYDKDKNNYIQQHNQHKIMTIPDIEKNERTKMGGYIIGEKDQKKLIEDLEKNRNNQISDVQDIMKKEQIDKVLDNQNNFFKN
jgi:hypothetical protein